MSKLIFECPYCEKKNEYGILWELTLPFEYVCGFCDKEFIIDIIKDPTKKVCCKNCKHNIELSCSMGYGWDCFLYGDYKYFELKKRPKIFLTQEDMKI